jgi:hypothetical protein
MLVVEGVVVQVPRLEPVASSSIAAVGYDAAAQILHVRFVSGQAYLYHGVPGQVHAHLLAAESKGAYFNRAIRDVYPFQRLGRHG